MAYIVVGKGLRFKGGVRFLARDGADARDLVMFAKRICGSALIFDCAGKLLTEDELFNRTEAEKSKK